MTLRRVVAQLFIAALCLAFAALFDISADAHAEDALEIQSGGWVTHYDGVLISRIEDGGDGSIEFGARAASIHQLRPESGAGHPPAGDYDVHVTPHDGSVQGFDAEHCRLRIAAFHHQSGSTFVRLICP